MAAACCRRLAVKARHTKVQQPTPVLDVTACNGVGLLCQALLVCQAMWGTSVASPAAVLCCSCAGCRMATYVGWLYDGYICIYLLPILHILAALAVQPVAMHGPIGVQAICAAEAGSTLRMQAARVMGNTYSSAKPSLPALNLTKVKHTPDNPDDLYIGSSHPQRNVVSLSSARLPGTARKLPPAQQLMSTQEGAAGPGTMEQQTGRIANNIVSKPQVPALNLGRHGDGFGSDQSLTARVPGHGPGSLPHVQRGAYTSRPAAYGAGAAATAQQQYASDTIRPSPAVETGPITPAQALKRYGEYLTASEQSEILLYTHIWFLGKADVQKIKGNPHLQKTNYGYDDERGDYHVTPRDHIAYRYEVQSVLGKGSFGQVLKVLDYKTGSYKALKVIRNKKRFHHQAQVELKVLEHLRQQDPDDAHHVIHIQEHFTFRNHLCITFELLSINLYEFIKQNNFAGLSLQLIKRFAAQMLVSLK
eukprot:GHRQ01010195.1.p1 GENE.GHRQ01010195.1~~GHRQ01010195.1.p1  ORF type:complete len:476 (+),score=152.28 GHRQ01010195.1:1320-2747(+)